MIKLNYPILVTSAITPPQDFSALAMQDANMRMATTKASIFFWVGLGVKEIVVVDSTLTRILNSDDQNMLKALGVFCEEISFKQDNDKVRELGLGFAEGNLIKFGVDNSRLISESGGFFKCTGKVFCRNFQNILNLIISKKLSNIFWQRFPEIPDLAETRFFFSSVDAFNRYILPCYIKSNFNNMVELELGKSFGAYLKKSKEIRPLLTGFSGGPGNRFFGGFGYQYEEKSYGDLDFSYPCWLNSACADPKVGLYL
ncbi:hypothetical protein G6688_07880 [Polynucleobacter paneuropaeus]|nr:hypothetical protein [Polynucleobacter paneuropaeus]MBT8573329.1 hypothetical protein [Polynucleobacter paneuropaeus]QWD21223.1 hypothetical protein G6689_07960 [Polynucleobacter paneuropaeus]QWD22993.1 hypothetical protein G6688_07880 [Polynucleobacter paneuropaeus]